MKNKKPKTKKSVNVHPLPLRESILPEAAPSPFNRKAKDKTAEVIKALEKTSHPMADTVKAMAASGRLTFLF